MTESIFRIVSHVGEGSYVRGHPRSLIDSDTNENGVRLAFKQYIPLDNLNPKAGDVTIIAGHANGIPKECYEPLFTEIWRRSKQNGFTLRSTWIADYYNHGESGILNEHIMGNDPCWTDHARDVLMFINAHRAEMPQPIVAMGHSGGSSQLTFPDEFVASEADLARVHLSLIHPTLFKALVFLECGWYPPNPGAIAAPSTLKRRDRWPSREAAAKLFEESSFYKIWDPRCLELFVKHGLRDAPTEENKEEVTLTTRKHQELATLLRPIDNHMVDVENIPDPNDRFSRPELEQLFRRLPEVKPPVFYLFGDKSGLWSARKKDIVESTGTDPDGSGGKEKGKVEEITLMGGTHFVPLEKVDECAEQVAGFLGREIPKWQKQQDQWRKEWQDKSRQDQLSPHYTIVDVFGNKGKSSKI